MIVFSIIDNYTQSVTYREDFTNQLHFSKTNFSCNQEDLADDKTLD